MIAKALPLSNARDTLSYLLGPEKSAQILDARMVRGLTPSVMAGGLERMCKRERPACRKPFMHLILSVSPRDELSAKTWRDVANKCLAKVGFSDRPFVAVRHRDREHDHVHILVCRVAPKKEMAYTSGLLPNLLEFTHEIDRDLDLTRPKPRRAHQPCDPSPAERSRASRDPGKMLPARLRIKRALLRSQNFVSDTSRWLLQLAKAGVSVHPARPDASGVARGVVFSASATPDDPTKRIYLPGSKLGSKWSLPSLTARLKLARHDVATFFRRAEDFATRLLRRQPLLDAAPKPQSAPILAPPMPSKALDVPPVEQSTRASLMPEASSKASSRPPGSTPRHDRVMSMGHSLKKNTAPQKTSTPPPIPRDALRNAPVVDSSAPETQTLAGASTPAAAPESAPVSAPESQRPPLYRLEECDSGLVLLGKMVVNNARVDGGRCSIIAESNTNRSFIIPTETLFGPSEPRQPNEHVLVEHSGAGGWFALGVEERAIEGGERVVGRTVTLPFRSGDALSQNIVDRQDATFSTVPGLAVDVGRDVYVDRFADGRYQHGVISQSLPEGLPPRRVQLDKGAGILGELHTTPTQTDEGIMYVFEPLGRRTYSLLPARKVHQLFGAKLASEHAKPLVSLDVSRGGELLAGQLVRERSFLRARRVLGMLYPTPTLRDGKPSYVVFDKANAASYRIPVQVLPSIADRAAPFPILMERSTQDSRRMIELKVGYEREISPLGKSDAFIGILEPEPRLVAGEFVHVVKSIEEGKPCYSIAAGRARAILDSQPMSESPDIYVEVQRPSSASAVSGRLLFVDKEKGGEPAPLVLRPRQHRVLLEHFGHRLDRGPGKLRGRLGTRELHVDGRALRMIIDNHSGRVREIPERLAREIEARANLEQTPRDEDGSLIVEVLQDRWNRVHGVPVHPRGRDELEYDDDHELDGP